MADFPFQEFAVGMAGISFGLIGVLMAGAAFFGERAEQAKRTWLPTTIQGLVLVMVASAMIAFLS